MHNSFEFATNGGKNLLFHNLGNGKFEDVTDKMGVGSTRWTLAAASADFNGDGWPDIYVANDYGPEELYLNDHGRRFVLTKAGLESESKSGMSVALGDAFNRGRLDAFVTNISERGYLFQNNNLRLNQMSESERFRNVADGQIADAGWAWGAQFGDLNNDGANELFVANGFISADRQKSYWYAMSKIAGANGRLFEDAKTLARRSATRAFPATSARAFISIAAPPAGSTSPRRSARRTSTTGAPSLSPISRIAAPLT